MKIVLLGDSLVLQNAGIKYFNLQLLKVIAQYPNLSDLTVVVPEYSSELSAFHQVEVPIKSYPLHQKLRHFTSIPSAVNRLDPDLVIEPAHFGPFRLKKSIKRCTVIHDLTPITHSEFHPLSSNLGHRLTLHPTLMRSDLILTNSLSTQISIKRFQPKVKRIQVLSPLINQEVTHSAPIDRASGKAYLLAIGTQEPRKDYITLLNAYAKIEEEVDLVIVGGQGWRNSEFDKVLENHPKRSSITMTGYVSDQEKKGWLFNASIFVAPSIAEGLGLPLLEVLPYQLPVVCSDLPSFREIGGGQFDYFPVGYSSVLAEKLSQVISRLPIKTDYSQRINQWKVKRKAEVDALFTTFDGWL